VDLKRLLEWREKSLESFESWYIPDMLDFLVDNLPKLDLKGVKIFSALTSGLLIALDTDCGGFRMFLFSIGAR